MTRVDGNYEPRLAACKKDAEKHGWPLYLTHPGMDIGYSLADMAGYTLIGREVIDQLGTETLTHCFYQ